MYYSGIASGRIIHKKNWDEEQEARVQQSTGGEKKRQKKGNKKKKQLSTDMYIFSAKKRQKNITERWDLNPKRFERLLQELLESL